MNVNVVARGFAVFLGFWACVAVLAAADWAARAIFGAPPGMVAFLLFATAGGALVVAHETAPE